MERITSCESTLSELVQFSSDFNIGDRVRRIAGHGVATATCSADTAGTIRYVGPIAPRNIPPQSNKPNTNINQTGNSPSEPSSPADPLSASNGSPTTNLPPSASSASLTNNNNTKSNTNGPIYIGVEWDMPVGKNDGSVDGVRYFTCEAGYGSFVLPKVLSKGLPLATLLEARYGSSTVRQEAGTITTASAERNTQTRPLQLGPAIGFRDPETGAFVKVVNCDCTANEQLGLAATAGGDKLGLLFPNLRDLSVAATLLASWDEVKLIGASLPNLATFDLSRNPALGAPTANHKDFIGNCDSTTPSSNGNIIISSSVQELRICDMKAMTPDCIEFLLSGFPNLKSLFAARNNLTLKGHSKKGLTKKNSSKHSNNNNNNNRDDDSNNNDSPAGTTTTTTTNTLENSSSHSSSSSKIAGLLTYLNIEGNEGIDCLEDVADLIGFERCQSLTALNVSSTSISDAAHLPPIEPDTVLAAFANKASNMTNNNPDSSNSNSVLLSSSNNGGGSSSSSSSNSPSKQNAITSSLFPEIPAPLFPNLTSLYMSKTPVRSWLALSRLMHRAANCLSALQDVHFSTTASDSVDQEQHDDGLSTVADEDVDVDDDSESASTVSVAGCFLPEDFRDRRRLSVAFMPPNVKKFNRSEITSVERSSAITRSIPQFLQLVRRIIIKNADDPEEAEEIEMICPKRLGDLPRHLHRQIVNEHQRGKTVSQNHGIGYIYRPASLGPRKVLNEYEVNIRCVFVSTKDQYSNFRGEFFRSVLAKIKEEEEEERLTLSSSCASPPQQGEEEQEQQGDEEEEVLVKEKSSTSQQNYGEKDLKKRNNAFGKVKLMIDVRWETKQLEAAVRDALGMNSPSASMNADPTKASSNGANNKATPINLFHIDKELMENPGAVAQGLHCKYLSRPWEKLHTSKVAENDDIIACIGP